MSEPLILKLWHNNEVEAEFLINSDGNFCYKFPGLKFDMLTIARFEPPKPVTTDDDPYEYED